MKTKELPDPCGLRSGVKRVYQSLWCHPFALLTALACGCFASSVDSTPRDGGLDASDSAFIDAYDELTVVSCELAALCDPMECTLPTDSQ
ncbi:MAG: hypothetical protein AAF411_26940, partial [Myxococcota bacterium]